jgi:uncharacterized protein YdeI (YjbR/CyaY-like superfamily)
MDIGETLYVTDRADWRAWLEKHHTKTLEIWLVFPKLASSRPRLPYNDAVDEALCFGWIDSIIKTYDVTSRAQRFTPRRPGSPLSAMNKERVLRLREAGLMTQAGLDAVGDVKEEPVEIAPDILEALQADEETWRHFQSFPESYKRIRIGFIEAARRRREVFKQRLDYFLKMTKQGKRFGMVQ